MTRSGSSGNSGTLCTNAMKFRSEQFTEDLLMISKCYMFSTFYLCVLNHEWISKCHYKYCNHRESECLKWMARLVLVDNRTIFSSITYSMDWMQIRMAKMILQPEDQKISPYSLPSLARKLLV